MEGSDVCSRCRPLTLACLAWVSFLASIMFATPALGEVSQTEDVFNFGSAPFLGSTGKLSLNQPLVSMASTASGNGYWLLARDGGVFGYGDAVFHGSTGDLRLNKPVVAMASDPRGRGYWFVAADGGVFAFDVPFFGSMGGLSLNQPIVAMAPTKTGDGYWLVGRDGGIFAFGDARFAGSTGSVRLNQPIAGMAADPDGDGYWLVARDGGVFAFSATFAGSGTGKVSQTDRIAGVAAHPSGNGYWLATARGKVFPFGPAEPMGDAYKGLRTIAAIAVPPTGGGYWLAALKPALSFPSVIVTTAAGEVRPQFSSTCWTDKLDPREGGICGDVLLRPDELPPLVTARRGELVSIRFTILDTPTSVEVNVADDPEGANRRTVVRDAENPVEFVADSPGLKYMSVYATWARGDVSYGLRLRVL